MRSKQLVRSRSILVCVCTLLFLLSDRAAGDQRGQIQLPDKMYNFGKVVAGQVVTHEFPIRNTGSGDLRIINTSPSCGCTVASVTPSVIAPGATALMKVEFDTSGFAGEKTKTVEVVTDDPASPRVGVSLKGSVLPGATVEPQVVEFGRLIPGDPPATREKPFIIRLPHGSGAVAKVTSASPFVEISERSKGELEAAYVVRLKPSLPQGHFRDRVVVEFSGSIPEPINVPITALVEGDIALNPPTVSFGVVSGAKPMERRVAFEYRAKEPLTINRVTTSDSAVSAFYQPSGKGMNGTIIVKLDPQRVRGDLKATVEISTNHPSQPVTLLNIYATVPPS